MSVVVAFKYKDGVIIGSDKRVSYYSHLAEDVITKIHRFKYSKNVIGSAGCVRELNVLDIKEELMDYKDVLDKKEVDYHYLISTIIPNLKQHYKNHGLLKSVNEIERLRNNVFIYATKDKIFMICEDFAVVEFRYFCAIGCGMELAMGALSVYNEDEFDHLTEREAIELMKKCIKDACKKDTFVGSEVDYELIKTGD